MLGDYQDCHHCIHVQSENRAIQWDAKKRVHDSNRIEENLRRSVISLPGFRPLMLRRIDIAVRV